MKMRLRGTTLVLCIVAASVALSIALRRRLEPVAVTPTPTVFAPEVAGAEPNTQEVPAAPARTNRPPSHLRASASDMTDGDKAEFAKEFAEKIKPVVDRWCKVYEGRLPFRSEDVSIERLRERTTPGEAFHAYDFVIDGTTVGICNDHGKIFVDYMMAPSAKDLFRLPPNAPAPAAPSLSRDEILRLLKADSGKDFPPEQIAIRPTGRSTAMNGGVSVDVGKDVNAAVMPLPKYAMVFDADGKLVCYGRSDDP